ncbi:hypothetical protein Hanom_Chr02g00140581 [Helianthus anomalus]
MKPFVDVLEFIKKSRIQKALTDRHGCYRSHIKDENGKDVDIPFVLSVDDIRRVLELRDNDGDLIQVSERLCKGLWFRMGYVGFVNDSSYNKSRLP